MKYIIFEGIDFTGKTTLINLLYNHIKNSDKEVILTKEPGSPHCQTCIDIRTLLMNSKGMDDLTYALLFSADAHEHLTKVVKPSLDKDIIVLSDRCMISDFAYRPNIDYDIKRQNFQLFKSLNPTILYLTCSIEEIEKRILIRSKDTPILEYERLKVLNRLSELHENYLKFLETSLLDYMVLNVDDTSIEGAFYGVLDTLYY